MTGPLFDGTITKAKGAAVGKTMERPGALHSRTSLPPKMVLSNNGPVINIFAYHWSAPISLPSEKLRRRTRHDEVPVREGRFEWAKVLVLSIVAG